MPVIAGADVIHHTAVALKVALANFVIFEPTYASPQPQERGNPAATTQGHAIRLCPFLVLFPFPKLHQVKLTRYFYARCRQAVAQFYEP
jgi:hypothetical protein